MIAGGLCIRVARQGRRPPQNKENIKLEYESTSTDKVLSVLSGVSIVMNSMCQHKPTGWVMFYKLLYLLHINMTVGWLNMHLHMLGIIRRSRHDMSLRKQINNIIYAMQYYTNIYWWEYCRMLIQELFDHCNTWLNKKCYKINADTSRYTLTSVYKSGQSTCHVCRVSPTSRQVTVTVTVVLDSVAGLTVYRGK